MPSDAQLPWEVLAQWWNRRTSFAEQLSDTEIRLLHIETALDAAFSRLVGEGRDLFLTGSPGDGKTHMLARFAADLRARGAYVELDASAKSDVNLARDIGAAISESRQIVVAINEGPLRNSLRLLPPGFAAELSAQLDAPLIYGRQPARDHKVVVINLGLRQALTRQIVQRAIDGVLGSFDLTGAPEQIRENVAALAHVRVRERLVGLLELAAMSGGHATMHELFGFLAYIATSGVTSLNEKILPLASAVFAPGNPLSEYLAPLDPAQITHPRIDAMLWDGDPERTTEWMAPMQLHPLHTEQPSAALSMFDELKRRYYFEATDGNRLLERLPRDDRRFYELLAGIESAQATHKADVVTAINSFFGLAEQDDGEALRVWTGLRYEAMEPCSAYVSSQSIPLESVSIDLPRIPDQASSAVEYRPDHVRVSVSVAGQTVSRLDVGIELWRALMSLKRGMPQQFQDRVIGRRLVGFMSSISAHLEVDRPQRATVLVRNVRDSSTFRVVVSLEKKQYQLL